MQAAEETGEDLVENDHHARFEEVVTTLRGLDAHAFWGGLRRPPASFSRSRRWSPA
jgi:hypothetical protein